ncbi:MAG: LacI family DNA-binding transcriptional regulator, partial [Sphingomonadales bacterium]
MGRRRQNVTIKHVAADAGVSLQTVSRVINNEPNVRPAMKVRVQESIDKLGYVPSIAAQRMSGSRSYLILAINDRDRTIADWQERQGSDWVGQMLLGGMLKCAEHGYRMIFELVDTHSDHVERELSAAIAALQPDGIILTPPHSENTQITRLLAERNIPFARIGSILPGPGIAMTMGDEGSARMATEYLIQLGHKRIGFIAGAREYSLSEWRVQGWQRAMSNAGLDADGLLIQGDFSYESGEQAAASLLDMPQPPTAIIASNDQMALAVLDVAAARGIDVPNALSLISFDNSPVVRFATPQLTAIDQPIAATFATAVELLITGGLDIVPQQPVIVA